MCTLIMSCIRNENDVDKISFFSTKLENQLIVRIIKLYQRPSKEEVERAMTDFACNLFVLFK